MSDESDGSVIRIQPGRTFSGCDEVYFVDPWRISPKRPQRVTQAAIVPEAVGSNGAGRRGFPGLSQMSVCRSGQLAGKSRSASINPRINDVEHYNAQVPDAPPHSWMTHRQIEHMILRNFYKKLA
jgi:hypothetical protein